jgi:hypothetical protein
VDSPVPLQNGQSESVILIKPLPEHTGQICGTFA